MSTFLGVPIIRIMVYWSLYWGPPILGNYHIGGPKVLQLLAELNQQKSGWDGATWHGCQGSGNLGFEVQGVGFDV